MPGDVNAMVEGRKRAHLKRLEQARERLGPDATDEECEAEAKRMLNEQKAETRRRNKEAKIRAEAAKIAKVDNSSQPPPVKYTQTPSPRPAPTPPPDPIPVREGESRLRRDEARLGRAIDSLSPHSMFGSAITDRASMIKLSRLPSSRKEHNRKGVSEGWLENIDFESFGEDYVERVHGGGRYEAIAIDTTSNYLGRITFTIAGPAKPKKNDDDDDDDDIFDGGNGMDAWRFRGGHPTQPQVAYDPAVEEVRRQNEELQRQIQELLASQAADENKLEKWERKLEQDRKERELREERRQEREEAIRREREEREERRAEQKLLELEKRLEAERIREESRRESERNLLSTMLQNQDSANNRAQQLITAMLTRDDPTVKMMGPMFETMGSVFSMLMDNLKPPEEGPWLPIVREVKESIGEIIKGVTITKTNKAPAMSPNAAKDSPSPGERVVFRLSDGRIVPEEWAAEYRRQFNNVHGREPTAQEANKALTAVMDKHEAIVKEQQASPDTKALPEPKPESQQEAQAQPQPEEKEGEVDYVSKNLLVELQDAYRAGQDPLTALENGLRLGKISPRAKNDLGEIYNAGHETVTEMVLAAFDMLKPHGVIFSPEFLQTFNDDNGASWLDIYLYGLSQPSVEEARKNLDEAEESTK